MGDHLGIVPLRPFAARPVKKTPARTVWKRLYFIELRNRLLAFEQRLDQATQLLFLGLVIPIESEVHPIGVIS